VGSPAPSPCVWRAASRTPRFKPQSPGHGCEKACRPHNGKGSRSFSRGNLRGGYPHTCPLKSLFVPIRSAEPSTVQRARRRVSRVLSRPWPSVGAVMAIPLGRSLPSASCDPPERRRGGPLGISGSPGMPAAPTWSCSRWGFPCRRRCRRRGALLPHRFTLADRPACRRATGGVLSVALSLGSPPPGVTRHRASVEPGLSSPRAPAESGHPTVWRQ